VVSRGIDVHESEMADLDGDGDLDILDKPYNGDTPRLDIWLQNGTGEVVSARKGSFNIPYGLEIYSLRFELKKDVPKTIALMKQMGFKDLEVSGYYGLTPKAFKDEISKNGLTCSSMIFDYNRFQTDIGGIIKEAKLFGAKYAGVGWIPHTAGPFNMADAKKACKDFNDFGAKLKKAGLKFFYHPHGYEFNTADGNLMDLILEQTKPQLVTFELDVFWATHGGADPLAYLKKYPGRFELMHLKEINHDVPGNNTGSAPDETSVSLGRGVTDWPRLLRLAQKMGTKKYYIEDEAKNAADQVPFSIKYLETLK
jgi:sugar phosphate isomerase/epimerase